MSEANDQTHDITLYDENGNPVAVIADGSIFRLGVDAKLTGVISIAPLAPKFDFSTTGVVLNTSTDTTLFTFSGSGFIDFITVFGSSFNFEFILKTDTVERLRITMDEVNALGLGQTNAANLSLWNETAKKLFHYRPVQAGGFKTGFTIAAKALSLTPTVTWFISYRT